MPYFFLKSVEDLAPNDWILVNPMYLPPEGRGPLRVVRITGDQVMCEFLEDIEADPPKMLYATSIARSAVLYASASLEPIRKIHEFKTENDAQHQRLVQELKARFDARMHEFLNSGLQVPARQLNGLEPIHGDVLPPVGSRVYILHGRDDEAHACTVVGYYVWPDLRKEPHLHRVFVRVVYEGTATENARFLHECYPTAEAALAVRALQMEC